MLTQVENKTSVWQKIAQKKRSYHQRAMGKDSLHMEMNTGKKLQGDVLEARRIHGE